MASSSNKCIFCGDDTTNLQNGSLKYSTQSQLCRLCSHTIEQGAFCDIFHGNDDGWTNCDDCGKRVHCGCSVAYNTFEINGTFGVTCNNCIEKRTLEATQVRASSSVHDSEDWLELEHSCSFMSLLTGGLSGEPGRANTSNDDAKNPAEATIEGSLNMSQLSNSGLLFLFEKKLAPTDCDIKAGRFLVPKSCAERFFPEIIGSQSMQLSIEDTEGRKWQFVLRWWLNKRSRKYVLDGTRKCVEIMQWNAGDKLKFYRKLTDGQLIIELERTCASASTSASDVCVHGDGKSNP